MDIYINNEKVDITLEDEKTLHDVLVGIETEIAKENGTIVSVYVNDVQLQADDLDVHFQDDISTINKLSLGIITLKSVKYSFLEIANNITELEQELSNISVLLQTGKDKEAALCVKKFADIIDYFCSAISSSALFPEHFTEFIIDDKNVPDFLSDFKQILSDFEESLTQKDTVSIGDLAEYEILPRLQKIKDFCLSLQKE